MLLLYLSGLLGTSGPRAALAQTAPEPVDLAWEAPEHCPGADAVRARIRELAGAMRPSGAPLAAEGTVTRTGGGFHLRLVIRAGDLSGTRNLDGTSCTDLAGAAAVALVLLLRSPEPPSQRELAGSTDEASGEPSPPGAGVAASSAAQATPAAPPATAPTVDAEPAGTASPSAGRRARRWRGLLQLPVIAAGLGPVEGGNLGAGVAAGIQLDPWRFLVEGRGWLRQQAKATGDEYGANLDRFEVSLRACRTLLRSAVELAPCFSLSVEHLAATGFGPQLAPSTDRALWLAIGAGGQARLPVAPWLTFVAGLDFQLQTSRPEIVIAGVGTVGQVGPVAATVMVGPEWIL